MRQRALRASVTSTEAGVPKGDLGRRSSVCWALPRNQCVFLCRRCNMDWRWPPTYGSGPFAPATPCTHLPGRYSGPNKFKRRVAHPWSWDIGSSTSAAQTSLNMVRSRWRARPFGLSTKLVGARQLVRQDGGSGGQFYGAQPLQPTQTRAPTGERLQSSRRISGKMVRMVFCLPRTGQDLRLRYSAC